MKLKKMIKSEKGAAMPLAMMVMVVLALLGTTLWFYSITDMKQVEIDQKRTQATYLAMSGADSVGQYLVKNPDNKDIDLFVDILDGKGPSKTINIDTSFLGYAGDMEVELVKLERTEDEETIMLIELTGKGYVDGVEQQVTLFLEKLTARSLFKAALEVNGEVDLSGVKVHAGPLISSGAVTVSEDHGRVLCSEKPGYYCNTALGLDSGPFKITQYAPFPHESEVFDERSDNSEFEEDDMEIGNNEVGTPITYDRKINKLEIKNNGSLVIDGRNLESKMKVEFNEIDNDGPITIKTNDNYSINIYVNDQMSSKGNIKITGFGAVNLYIRNKAAFQTPIKVTSNANLKIFLERSSELSLLSGAHIQGYIYGPEATVRSHSAQSSVTGAIIANSYVGNQDHIDPAGELIYVPYAFDDDHEHNFGYTISYWSR